MKNFKKIGKIKDAQGLKGDVFIIFFSKDYSWATEIETFYLQNQTALVVENMAPHKEGLKVKFKSVSNRNQSEALKGQELYLPENFFESNEGEAVYLSEIENFQVIDSTYENVGVVTGFYDNGAQDILIVTSEEKVFDIPFVDDFIEKIDYSKKIIFMNLPEGLLQINNSTENEDSDS